MRLTLFTKGDMGIMKSRVVVLCSVLVLAGCAPETKEEKVEYPERVHAELTPQLVLTRHQLEHIQFETEAAIVKAVDVPLSLPARVALNEKGTAHISARAAGRVEAVHRVAGERVRKGEILVELFSPEFLTMQSEFIQAEERFKALNGDSQERVTAKLIYESARRRLTVIGVSEEELVRLAEGHEPATLLPVRSPLNGTLLQGQLRPGEYVNVGAELFTVADLSRLWVIADVFEHDLSLVATGQIGTVTVTPYPSEKFKARLVTIYDIVDDKSRTVKTRFEVDNPGYRLKPEMFATVLVNTRFNARSPIVRSSAILEARNRRYVFVEVNDTTFEQRDVTVGYETQMYSEVLAGLKAGEVVVTKGTFYLKSELAKATFVEEE
jgi:RND family efflux transporter MFP subunit